MLLFRWNLIDILLKTLPFLPNFQLVIYYTSYFNYTQNRRKCQIHVYIYSYFILLITA
jgi:hypothetical protein